MSIRLRRAAVAVTAVVAVVTGGVVHAQADPAESDAHRAEPVRSMTFNVCGSSTRSPDCKREDGRDLAAWTDDVAAEVVKDDSDIVGFQELCIAQWKSLRRELAGSGYKAVWVSTIPGGTDGCRAWDPDDADNGRFGLGVFVKTDQTPERLTKTLETPDGLEGRAVLCARAPVRGVSILACNTHLAQYIEPDNGVGQVLGHIDGWKGDSELVLTADLNAAPFYSATDALYERYLEADSTDAEFYGDECPQSAETCRSGEPTTDDVDPRKKFDFIFTTTADPADVSADATPTSLADHHILRAVTML